MMSQARKQIIATQNMSTITRSKGNQAMNFGQLMQYNMRNIFLENYVQNLLKQTKSLDQQSKFYTVLFSTSTTLAFLSSRFAVKPKTRDKYQNILRTNSVIHNF